MEFVLHILNKHLTNERGWLRNEKLGKMDVKYQHAAVMAKKRVPQLEKAIEIIKDYTKVAVVSVPPPKPAPLRRARKEATGFI